MPSEDLLQHFQRELKPAARWRVGGEHYQRIAAGWLANLDRNSDRARPLLAATYGTDQPASVIQTLSSACARR